MELHVCLGLGSDVKARKRHRCRPSTSLRLRQQEAVFRLSEASFSVAGAAFRPLARFAASGPKSYRPFTCASAFASIHAGQDNCVHFRAHTAFPASMLAAGHDGNDNNFHLAKILTLFTTADNVPRIHTGQDGSVHLAVYPPSRRACALPCCPAWT